VLKAGLKGEMEMLKRLRGDRRGEGGRE